MKIPLFIRQRYGHLATYAYTTIIKQRLRPSKFYSLVDTGSPWTVITPSGACILKISTKTLSLPPDYPTITFAGLTFKRYMLKNVNIILSDGKSNIFSFPTKQVGVLEPTKKIDLTKFPEQLLIGCDFLEDNNLGLYFNPSNNVAYLQG